MSRIDEIKGRLSKIQGAPWEMSEYSTDYYYQGYGINTVDGNDIANCIENEDDAKFISDAPTDVQYLLDKLEQTELVLKAVSAMCKGIEKNENIQSMVDGMINHLHED